MSPIVTPRPHRLNALKVAPIACMIAAACSGDELLVSPHVESPETEVVVSSAHQAKDRPVDDPVADVLERLVPALGTYGIPLRAPLLALHSRPNRAAWDAVLRTVETTGATLPQEYQSDLDALRLELHAVAPR
jgi:hypothetical protein